MEKTHDNPMISVIVPVYNIVPYIRRCIESILNQTYKNLEIILVDDGSTDASGETCDEYAKNDSRIRVIHKKNGGLVSARKAGIAKASGVYATYVDGDDWIEPNMYAELIKKIGDADIIVSGVHRDYKTHSICEVNKIPQGIYEGKCLNEIYSRMIYTGKFFERGIQPHVYNSLFKRNILMKNQMDVPNEINVGEDAACFYPTLLNAEKIVLVNESYYHYVMRDNSIMGVNDGKELERYKILYKYLSGRFEMYSECRENMLMQLKYMMVYTLLLKEIRLLQSKENLIFPYKNIELNSKVIVYGKGRFGKELVNYLRQENLLDIVLWTDSSNIENDRNYVSNERYDYIIVAVLVKEISDQIKYDLEGMGVDRGKIKCIDENEISWAVGRIEEILG